MWLLFALACTGFVHAPPSTAPAGAVAPVDAAVDFSSLEHRVSTLLATSQDVDQRDRLAELRDLMADMRTRDPASQRRVFVYVKRAVAIEERARPETITPEDFAPLTEEILEVPTSTQRTPSMSGAEGGAPPPSRSSLEDDLRGRGRSLAAPDAAPPDGDRSLPTLAASGPYGANGGSVPSATPPPAPPRPTAAPIPASAATSPEPTVAVALPTAGSTVSPAPTTPPAPVVDPLVRARRALSEAKYLDALAALDGADLGPAAATDLARVRKEAIDGWARTERERAGRDFLAARARPRGEERSTALVAVRDRLAAINARFPDNSYAADIAKNVALVEEALSTPPAGATP